MWGRAEAALHRLHIVGCGGSVASRFADAVRERDSANGRFGRRRWNPPIRARPPVVMVGLCRIPARRNLAYLERHRPFAVSVVSAVAGRARTPAEALGCVAGAGPRIPEHLKTGHALSTCPLDHL